MYLQACKSATVKPMSYHISLSSICTCAFKTFTFGSDCFKPIINRRAGIKPSYSLVCIEAWTNIRISWPLHPWTSLHYAAGWWYRSPALRDLPIVYCAKVLYPWYRTFEHWLANTQNACGMDGLGFVLSLARCVEQIRDYSSPKKKLVPGPKS